jgi:hypothetical protein
MAALKNYWFKPKRYGWGWGLPATWQGWVSFGIFIAVWLLALTTLIPTGDSELKDKDLALFISVMLLDVVGLVYVSFKYGEPPKWRWGKKK